MKSKQGPHFQRLKVTHRHTDRQRATGRQTDRMTNLQTHGQRASQPGKQINRQSDGRTYIRPRDFFTVGRRGEEGGVGEWGAKSRAKRELIKQPTV